MSIFELYQMQIPLFIPSLEFLYNMHVEYNLLSERTWYNGAGSWYVFKLIKTNMIVFLGMVIVVVAVGRRIDHPRA